MKIIQSKLLDFLEDETDLEENFQNFTNIIEDQLILTNRSEFKSFLHLLIKITNNHQRGPNFISKIEKILTKLKKDIIQNFSNGEIFTIFKSNKRILLFLVEEQIMTFDEYIVKNIIIKKYAAAKYPQYFQPEIKPFINSKWIPKYEPNNWLYHGNEWVEEIKKEIPDNFYELRKKGENDSPICELIRKDQIKEFIIYVSKNNIALDSYIELSNYETNSLFLKQYSISSYDYNKITLIEYAAFFGSIQIFNYLKMNEINLTSSLWIYAIHGQNNEIFNILEDNKILPEDESYKNCLFESIASHHNNITKYFIYNHINNDEILNLKDTLIKCLGFYNFSFIQNYNLIDQTLFDVLCKFDYIYLIENGLKEWNVDVNKIKISIIKQNSI